uniref:CASP8-associated protein 2 n=1 Tax=Denticeps clupeoides TaxID=299321 RepID=A0AAY4BBD3_9TELE
MEEDVLDTLYGDFEPAGTHAGCNEDSVDIYSGLSPNARNGTFASPKKSCGESMDLYEQLLTEEQQEKEASYNELRQNFSTVQNQLQELMQKMHHNTSLQAENTRLKKNICSLLKTAQSEIVRKDEEIQRLNCEAAFLRCLAIVVMVFVSCRGKWGSCGPRERSWVGRGADEAAKTRSAETSDPSNAAEKSGDASGRTAESSPSRDRRRTEEKRREHESRSQGESRRREREHRKDGERRPSGKEAGRQAERDKPEDRKPRDSDAGEGGRGSSGRHGRPYDRWPSKTDHGKEGDRRCRRPTERPEKSTARDRKSVSGADSRDEGRPSSGSTGGRCHDKNKRSKGPEASRAEEKSEGGPADATEDSSPNRKLSFMETLNLTLSPVKKPAQLAEAQEQDDGRTEEAGELEEDPPERAGGEDGESEVVAGEAAKVASCDEGVACALPASLTDASTCNGHVRVDAPSSNWTNEPGPEDADSGTAVLDAGEPGACHEDGQKFVIGGSGLEAPPSGASAAVQVSRESVSIHSVSSTVNIDAGSLSGEKSPATPRGPAEGALPDTPKVSSTSRKESETPDKVSPARAEPAAGHSDLEPDSTENAEPRGEPSGSVAVAHDEDSMTLTLKSISLIPDAISPLTSPVRPVKRSHLPLKGKQAHVKSLSKGKTSLTAGTSSVLDVNKENKKPDSPPPLVAQCTLPSSTEEDELEDGEIVSENDEGELLCSSKSPKNPKESEMPAVANTERSPRSPRLAKKAAQLRARDAQKPMISKQSPSSKRRFKIVLPPDHKNSLRSTEEVMDMFKTIRFQLRKKYMKLHKSFPKKCFSSIIEMSQLSFTDLVNNANLSKMCPQSEDLKDKLNKIISSVMKKISNNGIVNRIFEQQSHCLKQKLWNFVDGQFDFLFKEIKAALASACKPLKDRPKGKEAKEDTREENEVRKLQGKPPLTTTSETNKVKGASPLDARLESASPVRSSPFRTGLGSRGKDITLSVENPDEESSAVTNQSLASSSSEVTPMEGFAPSLGSPFRPARRLSHGSILDKSDFELLTEQQTSSLTFNLVTDSQMGEIFKCLLQGSDLLDSSISVGEQPSRPPGTPRKQLPDGGTLTGMLTPSKFGTPSKVITTWISPFKLTSPNGKVQVTLNPALLDESCLMEVPSSHVPKGPPMLVGESPLKSAYSILAEDLAVSLTIPSPLKSEGHLSFLCPVNGGDLLATPDSVISAHYSEDALLSEEDASEQDIHLALDSDNSSSGSSAGKRWGDQEPPAFQFNPHLPMQAVVTERSNDHFIVKIRHTSPSAAINLSDSPTAGWRENSGSSGHLDVLNNAKGHSRTEKNGFLCRTPQRRVDEPETCQSAMGSSAASSKDDGALSSSPESQILPELPSEADVHVQHVEAASQVEEPCVKPAEHATPNNQTRKRKKSSSEPEKAKRAKSEVAEEQRRKRKHKKQPKSREEKHSKLKSHAASPQTSPGLSAKNVIRKRGEVVVTWTRDEDRDILVELKTKGSSSQTFSALSEKLKKSPSQIAERFSQLMKLFKKKEKMESS